MNVRKKGPWGWSLVAAGAMALGVAAIGGVSLLRSPADAACCYFAAQEKDINQPGQKVFITWDAEQKLESWTVQPRFEGNAFDFGMVIPSPARPKLDEMPRDFFKDLAIYTILMPLPQRMWTEINPHPRPQEDANRELKDGDHNESSNEKVKVLEAGVVGSLDYKIIVADEANALFDWLKENKYSYSGDSTTLDFYIQKKWFFTVMKIDPRQMKKNADGSYVGDVTPTRFSFKSDTCVYPLRITALSVKDKTDALFYVQAAKQMDLTGDLSWMHSYRTMWLTFMLGCAANSEQQTELNSRNEWVTKKKAKDPNYETTKLEWARKLGDAEMSVLEDPLKNYALMGGGDLPAGAEIVSSEAFLKDVWEKFQKNYPKDLDSHIAKQEFEALKTMCAEEKGSVVHVAKPQGAWLSEWMWYANREAPAEDVKGLARLKGHLQKGQWLTKFRKILRKDEMSEDLELVPVPDGQEQEYIRIMPTSPP